MSAVAGPIGDAAARDDRQFVQETLPFALHPSPRGLQLIEGGREGSELPGLQLQRGTRLPQRISSEEAFGLRRRGPLGRLAASSSAARGCDRSRPPWGGLLGADRALHSGLQRHASPGGYRSNLGPRLSNAHRDQTGRHRHRPPACHCATPISC